MTGSSFTPSLWKWKRKLVLKPKKATVNRSNHAILFFTGHNFLTTLGSVQWWSAWASCIPTHTLTWVNNDRLCVRSYRYRYRSSKLRSKSVCWWKKWTQIVSQSTHNWCYINTTDTEHECKCVQQRLETTTPTLRVWSLGFETSRLGSALVIMMQKPVVSVQTPDK